MAFSSHGGELSAGRRAPLAQARVQSPQKVHSPRLKSTVG